MVTTEQIDLMKLMGVEVDHCTDSGQYEVWFEGDFIASTSWSKARAWEMAWECIEIPLLQRKK